MSSSSRWCEETGERDLWEHQETKDARVVCKLTLQDILIGEKGKDIVSIGGSSSTQRHSTIHFHKKSMKERFATPTQKN